jgi:hypothetical protein
MVGTSEEGGAFTGRRGLLQDATMKLNVLMIALAASAIGAFAVNAQTVSRKGATGPGDRAR